MTSTASPVECESPIFVVGCARSGTALLRNLLRSHPRLTFPDESHFIPGFYRRFGDPGSDAEARRVAGYMLSNMWVKRWELGLSPDDFADCRSFREMICRLYGEWARREGKPRWGDKTPHYLTEIPLLRELFPEAQFIHIYRDGRDVTLSWLRRTMEPGNTYMAARYWTDRVGEGLRVGRALPPGAYLEVCYEELLSDSRAVMGRVCEFLGETFCEDVLKPDILDLGSVFKRRAMDAYRRRPQFRNHIVSDNSWQWRTKMGERQRVLVESIAGDVLEELGYEVAGPRRVVSAPERAFWRAHHAVFYVAARLRSPVFVDRLKSYFQIRGAALRKRS